MPNFEAIRLATFRRHADDYLSRIDRETGGVPHTHIEYTASVHSSSSGIDVRSTAEAAVALAMTDNAELAWKALDCVLAHQDTDPQGLTHGNFRWHGNWTWALDVNAVSFIVPRLWYIWRHRREAMPDALQQRLLEALALALPALNAHRATWQYTNIALLNIAAKLCIAEMIDDSRARKIAWWDWEEWRNHTAHLGAICEYNSPTYTMVQIEALAVILALDSPAAFHREIRSVLRHLVTATVLDYHEGIGVPTGPASRTVVLRRGENALDELMHYALDAPAPVKGCEQWLGVPLTGDDVLAAGRNRQLPRTTEAATHGYRRVNYLAEDFALSSTHGRAGWAGHTVPFQIAYRTANSRCTMPVQISRRSPPDALFASQHQSRLLGAGVWLVAKEPQNLPDEYWRSERLGLNCGRPDNVCDATELIAFVIDLGPDDDVVVCDSSEDVIVATTESVHVAFRFFGSGKPALQRTSDDAGEQQLTVRTTRAAAGDASPAGIQVSAAEIAVFVGFYLHIEPATKRTAAELAAAVTAMPFAYRETEPGWQCTASMPGEDEMTLAVDPQPAWMYSVDGVPVTANQWAADLFEEKS